MLFRQQFRHDIRAGRFTMEFAPSAPAALERVADATGVSIILILSDINMPGMVMRRWDPRIDFISHSAFGTKQT
jgi:CheY-like chemotaxis protein